MVFEGCKLREQGVTFGIVIVKDRVLQNATERDQILGWSTVFFGCPTVLLTERSHQLYGRRDLVAFLSKVNLTRIPWRRYTVAA